MEVPQNVRFTHSARARFDADIAEEELAAQDATLCLSRGVTRPICRAVHFAM